MKRRMLLAAAVVAALLCSAFALPALASSHAPAGPPPPVRVNLHSAMVRHLPDVRPGKVSGIIPPIGKRAKARPAITGCTEPNCDLVYQGGSVQLHPHVYILLWGPNWTTSDPAYGVMWFMFHGLGATTDDAWSTITSQYADASGHPAFGARVFAGAFQDTTAPPNPVTNNDIYAEADALASQQGITDLTDAQIVVASQSGTCFSTETGGFAGSCGVANPSAGYCAWHSSSNEPVTNLPYQLDAGILCGENMVNAGSAGTYDATSLDAGHEYAESITDPFPDTGWIDLADTVSGGEIGDKCVNVATDLRLTTGVFAMQGLWSNAAGGCVMSNDRVSVASPGGQSSVIGAAVSLQLHATSSTGAALSFRASGLPAGLGISASGRVSGTPGITAGTYRATVTARDANGASGSASLTWAVRSGTGAVKGYGSKCADDYLGRTANGNKIDISTCTGRNPQKMTFLANGEVTVEGKCLRDSGARVILYSCNGATTEQWLRHANGEYTVRYNNTCLTAPSATNGAQLTLARCTDTTHQRWSLP